MIFCYIIISVCVIQLTSERFFGSRWEKESEREGSIKSLTSELKELYTRGGRKTAKGMEDTSRDEESHDERKVKTVCCTIANGIVKGSNCGQREAANNILEKRR